MDKQLAQHRTQEQGSRIAAAAHLNYEFAMFRRWKVLIASRLASALKVDSKLGGHLPPMRLIQVPV